MLAINIKEDSRLEGTLAAEIKYGPFNVII